MIKVFLSCAMRGRNPENPSDRTSGIHLTQRLEINASGGVCNTITTVAKDSLVLEISYGNRCFKKSKE